MQDKINKIIYIILILLIIGFLSIFIYNKFFTVKEYAINFETLGKKASIRLYNIDKKTSEKTLKEIKQIFDEFTDLTNKKKAIDHNLYYIKNNNSDEEYIEIDKKLYDLIAYGLSWYDKSDGLIDISSGDIIDAFNDIKDTDKLKDLKQDIKLIELKDGKIKNNHININLNDVLIGYVVAYASNYLEDNNINSYYIYVDGLVSVGKHYEDTFSIGLQDPSSQNDVYQVVYANNKAIATTNYDGSMINLKTYEEADSIYGLSVIGSNIKDTYVISKIAFLKDLDSSKDYIDSLPDYEAIWFKFDKKIEKSSNIKQYLKDEKVS